jgi:RIO kinase 1
MVQQSISAVEGALDEFFGRGLITAVLSVVKSGKEATVYRCAAGLAATLPDGSHPDLLAAKIYKPLEQRGFKNDSVYQAGRYVPKRFGRSVAVMKKTDWGRDVQLDRWVAAEYDTQRAFFSAGAAVPAPIGRAGRAILMTYYGDAERAAPKLSEVTLPQAEAPRLFERLMRTVALFLAHHRVHADLSPHNVLYWEGAMTVIDFPQAVDPRFNPNARMLLDRDVQNVCRYFERYGIETDAWALAEDLWDRYLNGELA